MSFDKIPQTDQVSDEYVPSALQSEIHRLFGRCLLRLQNYEVLAKYLLVLSDQGGTLVELAENFDKRIKKISPLTLGGLINELTGCIFVEKGSAKDEVPEDDVPVDQVTMSFQFRIETDSLQQIASEMNELVEMRNELVHHFLTLFNLADELSCEAALLYLEDCFERIGRHHDNMKFIFETFTYMLDEIKRQHDSQEYLDFISDGIMPDGQVDWHGSRIITALKEAASKFSDHGWTNLNIASKWIEQNFAEQNPSRYKRRSWQQVLQDSGLFEIQIRINPEDRRKVRWYRARPAA